MYVSSVVDLHTSAEDFLETSTHSSPDGGTADAEQASPEEEGQGLEPAGPLAQEVQGIGPSAELVW